MRQAEHERQQQRSTDRPAIDFDAVRATVTLAAVLGLLGFRPRSTHGAQQRGPCPLHGSTSRTSRCFSANLEQHAFHCFKCGHSGNALDLWAQATRQSVYEAALDLCHRLSISVPLLPSGPRSPKRKLVQWKRTAQPVIANSTERFFQITLNPDTVVIPVVSCRSGAPCLTVVQTASGSLFVVAFDSSVFGAGWSFSEIDKLLSISASGSDSVGELMVLGSGGYRFYTQVGSSTDHRYLAADGFEDTASSRAFGPLRHETDNTWNYPSRLSRNR
jgi:hypothetical protein